LSVRLAIDFPPSRNVTLPVAELGETLTVNITGWLAMSVLAEEVRVTVVGALLTVWARAAETELAVFASPPYTAVIE
jgi:hypothetical protein